MVHLYYNHLLIHVIQCISSFWCICTWFMKHWSFDSNWKFSGFNVLHTLFFSHHIQTMHTCIIYIYNMYWQVTNKCMQHERYTCIYKETWHLFQVWCTFSKWPIFNIMYYQYAKEHNKTVGQICCLRRILLLSHLVFNSSQNKYTY